MFRPVVLLSFLVCMLSAAVARADELPPRALARVGSYRLYHGPDVHSAVVSPDGRMIASASWETSGYSDEKEQVACEKIIVLWDCATGKRTRELEVPYAPAYGLVFSLDGKQLAAGFGRKTSGIALFDVDSGKLLKQIADGRLGLLQFSPDGKSLFLRENFGETLSLWDIAAGKRTRGWERPIKQSEWVRGREYVCAGKPSPDGKYLAWLVDDPPDYDKLPLGSIPPPHVPAPTALIIVDTVTEIPVYRKEFPKHGLDGFTFYGDGQRFMTGGDTLTAYETATGKKLFDLNAPSTYCFAISPNGRFAVTTTGNSQIRLWNLDTKKPIHELLTGMIPVSSGLWTNQVFSADGTLVLIPTLSTLRMFDTATGKEHLPLGHRSRLTPRFAADGRTLVTTCDELRRTWDLSSPTQPKLLREERRNAWEGTCGAQVVAHSPDGRYFIAGRGERQLQLCETATGKVVRDLEGNPYPIFGMFSQDTTRLLIWYGAIAEDFDGFRLYDPSTGKKTGEMKTPNRVGYHPAISSDGHLIAWADRSHAIHLHDGASGKLVRTLRSVRSIDREECNNADILFTQDGTHLIVTTYLHDILRRPDGDKWYTLPTRVFRVADGREIGRFYSNPDTMNRTLRHACAACSPDGRLLALAEPDSPTIRLIEIASGKVRAELTGHHHGVHGLAFAPDGKTLASGGKDTVAILWDVTGARTGAAPPDPTDAVLAAWWTDLAADDAKRAGTAVACMVRTPDPSVVFLKQQLRPVEAADEKRLSRLLTDLDSETFERREAASEDLAQLGELAEPALRRSIKHRPAPEAKRRMTELLDMFDHGRLPASTLRALRAVEALEHLGTPSARQALSAIARGAAGSLLTHEAKASLERLDRIQPTKP